MIKTIWESETDGVIEIIQRKIIKTDLSETSFTRTIKFKPCGEWVQAGAWGLRGFRLV